MNSDAKKALAAANKYTEETVSGMGAIKGEPGPPGPKGDKGDKGDPGVGADINIEDIKDVFVTDVQPNDILMYDENANGWVNKNMPTIPSRTSDLTNDRNYQTKSDINTILENYAKSDVVPKNVSDLEDADTYVNINKFNTLVEKVSDIELFKFPNAIIHGEPTINNGQISDFSDTSYLVLPSIFDLKGRGFEFKFVFTTKNDITSAQNILGSKFCMALYIQNGKLTLRISSNGSDWNLVNLESSVNIEANKTYYVKMNFTRLKYTLSLSTDDEIYTNIGSAAVGDISPYPSELYIGIGNSFINYFRGIINFNKCYLKVNQSIIWQGMDDAGLASRLATDLDNIDDVGIEAIKEIIAEEDYIKTSDLPSIDLIVSERIIHTYSVNAGEYYTQVVSLAKDGYKLIMATCEATGANGVYCYNTSLKNDTEITLQLKNVGANNVPSGNCAIRAIYLKK